MDNICVVVIPVYKAQPSEAERASFRQTLTVLRHHPIVLVTHRECQLDVYSSIMLQVGKEAGIEYFDQSYFCSVASYNDLCFSPEFYDRFIAYEYMLICQLDVWLFSDQLDYWCQKGYDYIGAPIYHAYTMQRFTDKFLGIGNGGFSLRRISHCRRITQANRRLPFVKPLPMIRFYLNLCKYTEAFTQHPLRRLAAIPTVIAKMFGIGNNLNYYISNHVNEDLIFGTWSNESWMTSSYLPDEETAARFSFEVNPGMLYQRIGNKLPFGCHAYEKHWKTMPQIDAPNKVSKRCIYVNARFLTQRRTGVERYAYELCCAMQEIGMDITLVCPNLPLSGDYDISRFRIVRYGVGASHFWEQLVLPFFFVGKTNYLLLSFTGLGSLLVRNKIMTVHDLSFLYNPAWFSKAYYYYYRFMTPLAIRTSRSVITVSRFSKDEIRRLYPFCAKKQIDVVYNACNAKSFSGINHAEPKEKYALAVSSIDPRKNLDTLIQAFAGDSIGCKLYVVGNYNKVFASGKLDMASSGNIVFLGRVDDERLAELYAGAECFISSSLYEGFGLPLLEAMTSGCPVLCSDIPVYHEVCGDSALYFEPLSPVSIRNAYLQYAAMSASEHEALRQRMTHNLQRFSWHISAEKIFQLTSV